MIYELTFICAHNIMKIQIREDKSIWVSATRTGLNNFYPKLVIDKQINQAKNIKTTNKKQLKEYEKGLEMDLDFLSTHSKDEIKEEIIKQMGLRGFKLIKQEEK